jgi:hypothetical protein
MSKRKANTARIESPTIKVIPNNVTGTWTDADHAYRYLHRTALFLFFLDQAHDWRSGVPFQIINRIQLIDIPKKQTISRVKSCTFMRREKTHYVAAV